jgi:outer membrane protein assembly factor BamD
MWHSMMDHELRQSNLKTGFLALLAALLAGCGGDDDIIQDEGPDALYERGTESMESGNFPIALAYFQALEARYPFSNVTRQAQLDMIYAYYRSRQFESAIDAADEFERENPTHPRVDYCLYMKGLSYFDQAPNVLERLFRIDLTERPPRDTMQAFSIFQELIRRFPNSQYVPDTRERMVFLRNRLAAYENHVASYYIERGAFVAAINRAKYALEHYPGAPATEESLEIMIEGYEQLGMMDLADDTRRVLDESFGDIAAAD